MCIDDLFCYSIILVAFSGFIAFADGNCYVVCLLQRLFSGCCFDSALGIS